MRLTVDTSTTLDGHIVDGGFAHTDALLLGRTTYDLLCVYWPQVTDPGELQEQPGRALQVHGSHGLIETLHDAGLVDENRIIVETDRTGAGCQYTTSSAARRILYPR